MDKLQANVFLIFNTATIRIITLIKGCGL